MKIFCSDIDNTLIYSYKHDIGNDKLLIDEKNAIPISYMTTKTKHMLEIIKANLLFVPITTRSLNQYKRINFHIQGTPKYALTSNGGILLKDNAIVKSWYNETISLTNESLKELTTAIKLLKEDKEVIINPETVDSLFVFTKTNQPANSANRLSKALNKDLVDILIHKQKLYIFPKNLNKGCAIKRLKEYLGGTYIISAGDSSFDLPMLTASNTALIPPILANQMTSSTNQKVILSEGIFSESILEYIIKNELR